MSEQAGKLYLVRVYARCHIQQRPKILVLFGDNMRREGMGDQAAQCRGEPNVLGIPTKWKPERGPGAFFSNQDYMAVKNVITDAFLGAKDHLLRGQDVAYPFRGIRTGFAGLEQRAPKVLALIHKGENLLKATASEVITVNNLGDTT